jgi:hypothetical protein
MSAPEQSQESDAHPMARSTQEQSGLEPDRFDGLPDGLNQSSSGWISVDITGSLSGEILFSDNGLWNSVDFHGS